MLRARQFVALSGLTAKEAIRQPICLLLVTACTVTITLIPVLLMYKFGEDGKLVRESSLACHFVFGLFATGYAASWSLAREMRSGTASAVLSKPVHREMFFLAKFAGICGLVAAFSACATIATLMSERVSERFISSGDVYGYTTDWQAARLLAAAPILAFLIAAWLNFRFRTPFGSAAFALLFVFLVLAFFTSACFGRDGAISSFGFRVQWRILPAALLVMLSLMVFAAIALGLSTRMGTAPTLALCAAIFLIGLMSDYLFGKNASSSLAAHVTYWVFPNWQHFWAAEALADGGTVPARYVLSVAWYALVYVGGVLCLGAASFRHAEMT